MKLPDALTKVFQKSEKSQDYFFSLLLEEDRSSVALWSLGTHGHPEIHEKQDLEWEDAAWDERIDALVETITSLTAQYHLVKKNIIYGLGKLYLTNGDNITDDSKRHIKTLTQKVQGTPLGFVPLHQALMFFLKKREGVPPSVILLGLSQKHCTVSVYRVGTAVGTIVRERTEDIAVDLEHILKEFKEVEILPSRILVYGSTDEEAHQAQALLLKYQWTTRSNFMHFPKIDRIPTDQLIDAVCFTGASELASEVGIEIEKEEAAVVAPAIPVQEAIVPDAVVEKKDGDEALVVSAEEAEDESNFSSEVSNVQVVDPQTLGFHAPRGQKIVDHDSIGAPVTRHVPLLQSMRQTVATFSSRVKKPHVASHASYSHWRVSPAMIAGVASGIVVVALLTFGVVWFLPKSTVTVYVLPKTIDHTVTVSVDPKSSVVDVSASSIPGRLQEASISGEQTVPATGKKVVGDTAKGKITVFNKSLSSRTFKKGTKIITKSLEFTLDDDVAVASASENLVSGSITYGKADGLVTAAAIGKESNLPSGTEFTFREVSQSVAVARSSDAFTGGTSRDITVVARADYDGLIKALEEQLVEKAKQDLTARVSAKEKLIDDTIETAVAEKVFTEELGQESAVVHGKATVAVSGISYNDDDITQIVRQLLAPAVASGYTLKDEDIRTTLSALPVKKKTAIRTFQASITGTTWPTIDILSIQQKLQGQSIAAAKEVLQQMDGIQGVSFDFQMSPWKDKLPLRSENIRVVVSSQTQ